MDRRTFTKLMASAAAVPMLAACTGLDARDDNRIEVRISSSSRFSPAGVTIKVGQTVAWRNHDTRSHWVTNDPERFQGESIVFGPDGADLFDSGELLPGGRFSHTFTEPGEYLYACSLHPDEQLVGTITVET